jgi:hypothetical protein
VTPYPKIETPFERDESFRVDTTRLRRPVYGTVQWVATEKVDGTNMRIIFQTSDPDHHEPEIEVRGKTDNASIPPDLLKHCTVLAERVAAQVTQTMQERGLTSYILYGEGYGPKIQNGGRYRSDQGFILFDVAVNDSIFLSDAQVTDIAEQLGIPRVPLLNGGEVMALDQIVGLVRGGFSSDAAETFDVTFDAEGVVARTVEPLYDNRGERLIIKLKTKDFRAGRR